MAVLDQPQELRPVFCAGTGDALISIDPNELPLLIRGQQICIVVNLRGETVQLLIRQRGIRRREFERFITELEKLPEAVSEFDDALWGSLVDYVTVGKDKTMVFTLIGGTEMKA